MYQCVKSMFEKHRAMSVLLLILGLQGCATTIDITTIDGLSSSKPFSDDSFADGSYRFSEGGFKIFTAAVDEAMIDRRYDDALTGLVKRNRANDGTYLSLAIIAESKGYYEGAYKYYMLAHQLNTEVPSLARCPSVLTTYQGVSKVCFMIDSTMMLESASRVNSKADGSWVDTIIEYQDGRVYIGDINEAGKPEGLGELTAPSGEFYYGYFKDGHQHGPGTLSVKTGSSTLYFKALFGRLDTTDYPTLGDSYIWGLGHLFNMKMRMLGFAWGKDMQLGSQGLTYQDNGAALGSRPADNNYWFVNSYSEGFARALQQDTSYYRDGSSPLLATDDPLIGQICKAQSPVIFSGARDQGLCD